KKMWRTTPCSPARPLPVLRPSMRLRRSDRNPIRTLFWLLVRALSRCFSRCVRRFSCRDLSFASGRWSPLRWPMPGSSFGHALRITTAGESHGPANVVILDGVPPGLALSVEDLLVDLDRRRPGQSRIVTQRRESDTPQILSGVFEGTTTGTSLAILIPNEDQRSRDYDEIKNLYRPGHADFTFDAKYGVRDYRGGGRSSARETNVRVAAGVVAKKILEQACGGRVVGYVVQVGDIRARIASPAAVTLDDVEKLADGSANIVRCPDRAAAERMIALIDQVRKEQDSVGGIAEIVATGIPAGLGEPVF